MHVCVHHVVCVCVSHQVFTSDGSFVKSWGSEGSEHGQFNEPWGITVLPNGNIAVCDEDNHRIQVCVCMYVW